MSESGKRIITVAVEGCTHGHMNQIYDDIKKFETENNEKVDLLVACGDYQSMRNMQDLQTMACPNRYKKMGDFFEYYSGKRKAPVMTVFVGGNHESSNHLLELYYGGWAAENIYFLGHSGCVNFKGLRIAGQSGIYKHYDYNIGYVERVPFNENHLRSIYHHRFFDEFKLCLLTKGVDIFLAHDWPKNIWKHMNMKEIKRQIGTNKHLFEGLKNGKLGAPGLENIYTRLKPRYFFSGHMHKKFQCVYKHDDDDQNVTNFLALANPTPRGGYLDFIKIEIDEDKFIDDNELRYDLEWLAILRTTNRFMSIRKKVGMIPLTGLESYVEDEKKKLEDEIKEFDGGRFKDLLIRQNPFVRSRETYDGRVSDFVVVHQSTSLENPQRDLLVKLLGIEDKIKKMEKKR